MTRKITLVSLALAALSSISLNSCTKTQNNQADTSNLLQGSRPNPSNAQNVCTPTRVDYADTWVYDLDDWYMACMNENVNLSFVGHWTGKIVTSASCMANDRSTQVWDAHGVGLTTGHTYYMHGIDRLHNATGTFDALHQRANFNTQTSTLTILDQTTGTQMSNMRLTYSYHVNANGDVVIDSFNDFVCP